MNKVPDPVTVITGEEGSVMKVVDSFLIASKAEHEMKHDAHPNDFRIESYELSLHGVVSNDRVTYLRYKEEVIALVIATRTEFNNVRYTFFKNPHA